MVGALGAGLFVDLLQLGSAFSGKEFQVIDKSLLLILGNTKVSLHGWVFLGLFFISVF
jgi:hypothetical protein